MKQTLRVFIVCLFAIRAFAQTIPFDTSFGDQGAYKLDFPQQLITSNVIAIQPDGKLLTAGQKEPLFSDLTYALVVSRCQANGLPDTTFNHTGFLRLEIGGPQFIPIPNAIKVFDNGEILVAGYVEYDAFGDSTKIFWLRLNPDGIPNSTYSPQGIVLLNENNKARVYDLLVQPDGKLVLAGQWNNGQFMLRRYLPAGAVDSTFGFNGMVRLFDPANSNSFAAVVIQQPDGQILAGGAISQGIDTKFALARFSANGVIDSLHFGTNGIVTTFASNDTPYPDVIRDLDLYPNGQILATGASASVRYNTDGTIDHSFGNYGKVNLPSDDAVIQQDGKILFAYDNNQYGRFIIRMQPDGAHLDSSFAINGKIPAVLPDGTPFHFSKGTLLQNDGKLVVGFSVFANNHSYIGIARYLTGLVLSTDDFKKVGNGMFIYPNPVQEQASVMFEPSAAGAVLIQLWDMEGNLLSTLVNETNVPSGKQTRTLRFPPGLSAGNYILSVKDKDGAAAIRISKLCD
jgi:uncharacterized delta-60 repeat protein